MYIVVVHCDLVYSDLYIFFLRNFRTDESWIYVVVNEIGHEILH